MSTTRHAVFWIALLAAIIVIAVLLREILVPFVAGVALAYVLNPLADRLERLGLNRLMATLVILALFIVGVVVLIYLAAPFLIEELVAFIERSPAYASSCKRWRQLQAGPGCAG